MSVVVRHQMNTAVTCLQYQCNQLLPPTHQQQYILTVLEVMGKENNNIEITLRVS